MTVAKHSKIRKPAKPYPEFPLWPNTNGQWSKKIRGKLYNFGVWSDWEAALEKYQSQVHDLQLGSGQPDDIDDDDSGEDLTLRDGINKFLRVQKSDMLDGEISPEHFSDLLRTLRDIVPTVINLDLPLAKLKPDHFRKLRKKFATKKDGSEASPATMLGHIRRVKILFRWLVEEGDLDREPAYGSKFGKLSKRQQTQAANRAEEKRFSCEEILSLLEHSDDAVNYRLRAMVLLAINAGLGPRDIGELTFDQLDLDNGWLVGQRNKTAVRRCAKLWPETVAALKLVLSRRFEPADKAHASLVFITRMKRPYLNKGAISRIFAKLKLKAGINGGRGSYCLRHVCRDIANQQADDNASRWIMGHTRNASNVDDIYTHGAPQERIAAVCDHIRSWFFEGGAK